MCRDRCLALIGELGYLAYGIALVVVQKHRYTVVRGQRRHRFEHRAAFFGAHVGVFDGGALVGGFADRLQVDRGAPDGTGEQVLAKVDSDANDPGALVLSVRKGLVAFEQLEEDCLADVLGVVGGSQIGVAQPQNKVGVGPHQAFGLRCGPYMVRGCLLHDVTSVLWQIDVRGCLFLCEVPGGCAPQEEDAYKTSGGAKPDRCAKYFF